MGKLKRKKNTAVFYIIAFVSVIFWLLFLMDTNSFFGAYIIIGIISACSILYNYKNPKALPANSKEQIVVLLFSVLLSFCVSAANYNLIFDRFSNFFLTIVFFIVPTGCGVLVFSQIILAALHLTRNNGFSKKLFYEDPLKDSYKRVFLITFLVLFSIDLIILILEFFPGVLTYDSIMQIRQINSGEYSNHHPFWHTLLIKLFYSIGYSVFQNENIAVCFYTVFQIIAMSLIVSYANMTLSQMHTKKYVNILFCGFFALQPYQIIYSFIVWKDVLFGGTVLLWLVSFVRYYKKIGNKICTLILLTIGALGFCLFRSNGWLAFVLTGIIVSIIEFKRLKTVSLINLAVIVVTFIMTHPLLSLLNVSQPDLVESLSIPIQQISRVIVEDGNISEEDYALLEEIVDIQSVKKDYRSHISDPVKNLIRNKGNQDYLKENMSEYIGLYLRLGINNPDLYLRAWIDQTKGYYNGGYKYWVYADHITNNGLNISRSVPSQTIKQSLDDFLKVLRDSNVMKPFTSIGLHVWGIIITLCIGILAKNKLSVCLCIPILMIVLSLLIATPVYAEFRYIYALFTSFWFIIFVSLKPKKENADEKTGDVYVEQNSGSDTVL